MNVQRYGSKGFFAAAAVALLLSAPAAWAACGDGILDDGEQCDGGACCQGDCTFTPVDTVCRPAVNVACDVDEVCSGASAECPADVLVGCSDQDGIDCTVPTCEASGECVEADQCVETCRGPGFWSTHSGSEHDAVNIGQSVIDAVGPLEICGQTIGGTTDVGSLDSALEALCVKTEGVKERQLYRQLVTAALNCAISEGGDCDQILGRFVDVNFSDCSALCAGTPVMDGPTLKECKSQLACFNTGGRLIEGQCAKGTCAEAPGTFCGAAYGDCPLVDDLPQECVPFEDNCADVGLCNQDLDVPATICPDKTRASSPKTCTMARKNTCTIDSCEP